MTRLDFSRLSARKKRKASELTQTTKETAPTATTTQPQPPPASKSRRVLQAYPQESVRVVQSVVAGSEVETKRILKQTPGFRRPFGASFGGNGQLVIPNADGTVQIILEPTGSVPAPVLEKELKVYKATPSSRDPHFADGRVAGYSKATDKRKNPRRDIVFRLLASVAGPSQPRLAPERDLVRDRILAVQSGRRERLDDWVRCCLGRLYVSGIQAGDVLHDCHRVLKNGTVDDLRAATILSQAPNPGSSAFTQLEHSKPPKAVAKLVDAVRGRRSQAGAKQSAWVLDFGTVMWYRKRALDPLCALLDDVKVRRMGIEPSDGCFALLDFVSDPTTEAFTRMLMRLRDSNGDWSLAFHVGRLFLESGIVELSPRKTALLFAQFAHQLELVGLWHWSLYLYMTVPLLNDQQRKKAVYEVLSRHLKYSNSAKRNFVRSVCKVSEQYLSYAQAIQHVYFQRRDPTRLLEHFADSGEVNECLHVFCSFTGPRLILTGRLDDYRSQVEALGLTRERSTAVWHLSLAWQWHYLQMGYVYLRAEFDKLSDKQRDLRDFLSVFGDFVDSLSSYTTTRFPRLSHARPLVYLMGDWVVSAASTLLERKGVTEDAISLAKVANLPMSPDTRRLLVMKHPLFVLERS